MLHKLKLHLNYFIVKLHILTLGTLEKQNKTP